MKSNPMKRTLCLALMLAAAGAARTPLLGKTFDGTAPYSDQDGKYSRFEQENFLCLLAAGFIGLKDVTQNRLGAYVDHARYAMNIIPDTRLIVKWTHDPVRVVCLGSPTAADVATVKDFIAMVNAILGEERFIYGPPDFDAANVVIVTEKPIFTKDDICRQKIRISGFCNFMLKPLAWAYGFPAVDQTIPALTRSSDRQVMVFIRGFVDQVLRSNALRHELMHALGFPGHSPDPRSILFPLQVCNYRSSRQRLLSSLDREMIGLLFRPEILPGMNLAEVKRLLPDLRRGAFASPATVQGYLQERRDAIWESRNSLLKQAPTETCTAPTCPQTAGDDTSRRLSSYELQIAFIDQELNKMTMAFK